MGNLHLALVKPSADFGTVTKKNSPPRRQKSTESRKHLTASEIERLTRAAGKNRWGHRDATMITICWRHGFRVSELVALKWDQVDFAHGHLHVRRLKKGSPATHPLLGSELRALRRLQRDQDPKSPYCFTSERGGPITAAAFRKMLSRLGRKAKFSFGVHPHQLRHTCGFALANRGTDTRSLQGFLGHKAIRHTVIYTELAPTRFKNIWGDDD